MASWGVELPALDNAPNPQNPVIRDFGVDPRPGVYLHDGRATELGSAILAHDGEARVARERYAALSPAEAGALLDFLLTL